MTENKYFYFRVKAGDDIWTCSGYDLSNGIIGWLKEYEKVSIIRISMTEKEFNALPEFQG